MYRATQIAYEMVAHQNNGRRYIFGWLFFVNGIAGTLYVLLVSTRKHEAPSGTPLQDAYFRGDIRIGDTVAVLCRARSGCRQLVARNSEAPR